MGKRFRRNDRSSSYTWAIKLLVAHGVLLGLPALAYCGALQYGRDLAPLQWVISTLYLLAGLFLIAETTVVAWFYTSKCITTPWRGLVQHRPDTQQWKPPVTEVNLGEVEQRLPRVSVVVVAYLPNEQSIILDTLKHILWNVSRPKDGLEVILAYNTPVRLPVEDELHALAAQWPNLRLLCVEHSHSKAENLNAALSIVTGEMTCIFDADHHPAPDCLERAWRWLETQEYDLVQGRNVIRNFDWNWLTRIIAVEFDCLYGVSHPARSLLVNTALFGGSNGYWRTSVLRRICFRSKMMTEDIDASVRTLLRGYNIVSDPTIIATELAPEDIKALWSQRQRWAQGWIEVSLNYQVTMLKSRYLDGWQKLCWLIMFLYSGLFHPLAMQALPLGLSYALVGDPFGIGLQAYTGLVTGLLLLSGPYQVLVAMRVKPLMKTYPRSVVIAYCLITPLYYVLKNAIAIVALYNHVIGTREWVVTRRGTAPQIQAARPQKPKLIYSQRIHR